jgi:hypothetical protein
LAFLADPRRRKIRNRMLHGLKAAEEFNWAISDRVLHILLVLARFDEPPTLQNSPQSRGSGYIRRKVPGAATM